MTLSRQAAGAIPLFGDVAKEFMRMHVEAKCKPRTLDSYEILLRKHILPALGARRVSDIRRHDVSKLHNALSGTPGAANRVVSLISAVWNWMAAERDDLPLPPTPAKGIKRNPEDGLERFLTGDELACLGDALARAETSGLPYSVDDTKPSAKHAPKPENRLRTLDPFAVAAIRLLLFTGARLREILHASGTTSILSAAFFFCPTAKRAGSRFISQPLRRLSCPLCRRLTTIRTLSKEEGTPAAC